MIRKYLFIAVLLAAGLFSQTYGQSEECVFKLQEAEELYNDGLPENIPEILDSCIRSGFTKDERLQAYKLIILSYLFDDDQEEAEQQMYQFLKRYPEYEITPADPADFVFLFNSYNALPLNSVSVTIGTCFSFISIMERYGTINLNADTKPGYTLGGLPLRVGASYNRYLVNHLDLNVEVLYSSFKFEFYNNNYTAFNNEVFGQIAYDETQNHIELPLSLTYDFEIGSFRPYVRLGAAASFMVNAKSNVTFTYTEGSHDLRESPTLVITDNRNAFNYWALAGGGIKYKIPKGFFMLDVRMNIGLNNQLKSGRRYKSEADNYAQNDVNWNYFYTDDDFRMNNLIVSVGFTRLFYKPKKKEMTRL